METPGQGVGRPEGVREWGKVGTAGGWGSELRVGVGMGVGGARGGGEG
jgi:hypothetical protein